MTWIHHEPPTALQKSAYVLLAVSVLLVGFTGYRAGTISPLPDAAVPSQPDPVPELGDPLRTQLWEAVRAVERDPFHPERRAPAERYLLPETGDTRTVSIPGAPQGGSIRLLGTVVSGESGGFVMCQMGRDTPKTLRVGETLGGLTLRRISRAEAEFERADGSMVTLRLPGTSATSGS